jgi:uncharacterized membrane protein YebE (DUF533 family)
MEEKKVDEVVTERENSEDGAGQSKRDFVAKLVTAAGLVALAGLAGTASGQTSKSEKMDVVHQKVSKVRNGFLMEFSGGPIGDAMIAAGIAPPGIDTHNARLTIEFTA